MSKKCLKLNQVSIFKDPNMETNKPIKEVNNTESKEENSKARKEEKKQISK